MEGNYDVRLANRTVGRVSVTRQGLYYRFSCNCSLSKDMACRLWMVCGDKKEDMGILVPMDDGFGMNTKVPVKRIGEGTPEFILTMKHDRMSGVFVPIYPEEPFAYISKLKNAYLVKQEGKTGICFTEG